MIASRAFPSSASGRFNSKKPPPVHIVEFTAGSLRFVDAAPERAPDDGFVWIYLDRTDFVRHLADVQAAA